MNLGANSVPTRLPLNNPSSHLPTIANIGYTSIQELCEAVNYLKLLYNPAVRGTRCVGRRRVYLCPNTTADVKRIFNPSHEPEATEWANDTHAGDNLVDIRLDSFERSYAIRWLTSLVSQSDRLEGSVDRGHDGDKLVQDAAALLAVCAGTASAGTVTRVFSFKDRFGRIFEIQVADAPLENQDFSSVGAQTWGSACLLSEMIVQSPMCFGLEHRPIRILELGAGTGLVSLTLATVLRDMDIPLSKDHTNWSITATDFHPSVLQNLEKNVNILQSQPHPFRIPIDIHFLDWSTFLDSPAEPPFDERFDLVFAADVIYEMEQAQWIKNCVETLLRIPENTKSVPPRFFLVVPVRPTHATESRLLEEAFPFADSLHESLSGRESMRPTLVTISKELLQCEVGDSIREPDAELVQYAFYSIAWGFAWYPPTI